MNSPTEFADTPTYVGVACAERSALPLDIMFADQILNSLDLGVLILDRSGTIHYRNTFADDRLLEGAEIQAVFAEASVIGTFNGWSEELNRVYTRGESLRWTVEIPGTQSSAHLWFTLSLGPLRDPSTQSVIACLVVLKEEGSSGEIEDRHEVSQRLISLGQLAARVAHELNNPLDGILRYVNLSLRLVDAESKLKGYLSESRTGLMRMVQIIGELLEYSRTHDGGLDNLRVHEVVEEAIRAHAARAEEHHVVIAADFQSRDMPGVHGSRLYQVCCNLIKNAIDAMPDGGRLCITTGLVNDDVVIRVADTGVGLPAEVDRLFEAFYTTKPFGKGTGLGLAICKDIVESMHGSITAAPGEENGAVFTVRIPASSFPLAGGLPAPQSSARFHHDQ